MFTEKNFHVAKYLELEMEFRTSELSGILLSVSEPNGFPALSLEINNGNVSSLYHHYHHSFKRHSFSDRFLL